MSRVKSHLQSKFLAGALAAIPLGVTAFIFWYLDSKLREVFGVHIPGLGIPVAIGVVYVLGLFVTSLVGQWLLGRADKILERLPGMRDLYRSWKQVLVTPDVSSGIFARSVLVPDESGRLRLFGFTTGRPLEGNADTLCVFLPTSPNPVSGRLVFVEETHEIERFYRAADILVLPSVREGLPNVVLEAMSSGVPAIAFPVGGPKFLIDNDVSGFVADTSRLFLRQYRL